MAIFGSASKYGCVLTPMPVGAAPSRHPPKGHEQVGRAVARVFAVAALGPSRSVIACRSSRAGRGNGERTSPINRLPHSSGQTTARVTRSGRW